MKNTNKVAIVAVCALLFSGVAFSQTVFSIVKVPGASPNSLIAINNSGQVVVNTGTGGSYQVSTWNRVSGAQSIELSGMGTAIDSSGTVVGAGDPDNTGNLQAFVWQPTAGARWLGSLGGQLERCEWDQQCWRSGRAVLHRRVYAACVSLDPGQRHAGSDT